jgi:putative ABC transport system ATP-binding protein
MMTLEAAHLSKIYRGGSIEVSAVQDVSLAAASGEMIAIMGPSGSGKTTLLSMLGCILRPTSGSVTIKGEQVWKLGENRIPYIRRHSVGFIFQAFNLFAALTAQENVEVALNLKGVSGRSARQQALRLLELVGLADRARFSPRDLSGGEKQRVSIARALSGEPPLILADEPTANLDSKNGERVMLLLRGVAQAGRAVVVVTHDSRMLPFVDRVVHLVDGRLAE